MMSLPLRFELEMSDTIILVFWCPSPVTQPSVLQASHEMSDPASPLHSVIKRYVSGKRHQNAQTEQVVIKHFQLKSQQQTGPFGTMTFQIHQLLWTNSGWAGSLYSWTDFTSDFTGAEVFPTSSLQTISVSMSYSQLFLVGSRRCLTSSSHSSTKKIACLEKKSLSPAVSFSAKSQNWRNCTTFSIIWGHTQSTIYTFVFKHWNVLFQLSLQSDSADLELLHCRAPSLTVVNYYGNSLPHHLRRLDISDTTIKLNLNHVVKFRWIDLLRKCRL